MQDEAQLANTGLLEPFGGGAAGARPAIWPRRVSIAGNRGSAWLKPGMAHLSPKRELARAALGGVIPRGSWHVFSQACCDVMASLRSPGRIEFSLINDRWNDTPSAETARRFSQDPGAWKHYHALYRPVREEWREVPFEEIAKWLNACPELAVGDFGCGEAILAKSVKNRVFSIDHVAASGDVIACDMSHTGLDDGCLDAAVFSLSLMGANMSDYLREAHRTLKMGGILKIAEPAKRWAGEKRKPLLEMIQGVGFSLAGSVRESFRFIYVDAVKAGPK
jgi:hypothetical protein